MREFNSSQSDIVTEGFCLSQILLEGIYLRGALLFFCNLQYTNIAMLLIERATLNTRFQRQRKWTQRALELNRKTARTIR